MSTNLQTALTATLEKAAREAGLTVLSAEAGTDFNQRPTAKFKLALHRMRRPRTRYRSN